MTRTEKCDLAISRGFLYNEETGFIYGVNNNKIKKVSKNGYLQLSVSLNHKKYYLYGHQFAYYFKYKKCVNLIDHVNRDKLDNRISNLRESTKQKNAFNMNNTAGCCYSKREKKWIAYISVNNKKTQLGSFKNKQEASTEYQKQKLNYHSINN